MGRFSKIFNTCFFVYWIVTVRIDSADGFCCNDTATDNRATQLVYEVQNDKKKLWTIFFSKPNTTLENSVECRVYERNKELEWQRINFSEYSEPSKNEKKVINVVCMCNTSHLCHFSSETFKGYEGTPDFEPIKDRALCDLQRVATKGELGHDVECDMVDGGTTTTTFPTTTTGTSTTTFPTTAPSFTTTVPSWSTPGISSSSPAITLHLFDTTTTTRAGFTTIGTATQLGTEAPTGTIATTSVPARTTTKSRETQYSDEQTDEQPYVSWKLDEPERERLVIIVGKECAMRKML
ncbi:hypothetical protein Q1695_004659 [Nippostrongylus brasiliensis]|nr:hypothetical protein Q1695_004659 [Nippostrongylus brasiliensis]